MPESLIDTLEGEGKVFSGDTFVADVRFKVRIYQQYEVSRTLAEGASRMYVAPLQTPPQVAAPSPRLYRRRTAGRKSATDPGCSRRQCCRVVRQGH
jgi:hypothetical protein